MYCKLIKTIPNRKLTLYFTIFFAFTILFICLCSIFIAIYQFNQPALRLNKINESIWEFEIYCCNVSFSKIIKQIVQIALLFVFANRALQQRTQHHNYMNQLNEDSNSLSIGFAPLEMRILKDKIPDQSQSEFLSERIQSLGHRLVTNIELITSIPIQSGTFRKQLKNYRFQRKSKLTNLFNDITTAEEREIQQLSATFIDLFSIWRQKIQNKMFITFNNGDLMYFIHKPQQQDIKNQAKKGGTFAVLSCKKSCYSSILDGYGIKYQKMDKSDAENQRILLKNNAAQQFWKYLMNYVLEKPIHFQIIANFYFLNSCEVLPIQNYNGKQQRPEFAHLVIKRQNVLGQIQRDLYSVKMQGLWFKQNAQQMYEKAKEMIQGKCFQINFQCHQGTLQLKSQVENL